MYTHIIHLADVHLRVGDTVQSRQFEYEAVIARLGEKLQRLECVKRKSALIVVCGDVFHNKNKLEATTVKLWSYFLKTLKSIGPVVFLCGNHDFRQDDPNCPDLIDAMLDTHSLNDPFEVKYLKDTGTYEFSNVRFGVVSIKDTLKQYDTCGMVDELPAFPVPQGEFVHVALFHGTITQSALPNGQLMAAGHGYPLEWFKGYNLALLGDNHKQQVHRNEKLALSWGYPGSLIQQDIGEPVFGHGFILWDLKTLVGKPHHVQNDLGRFRVKFLNSALHVKVDHESYIPLEEVVRAKKFPKTPVVQIVANTGEEMHVRDIFSTYGVHPTSIQTILAIHNVQDRRDDVMPDGNLSLDAIASMNHPSKWLEFINSADKDLSLRLQDARWFEDPCAILMDAVLDTKIPETFRQKIADRREKIYGAIETYKGLRQKVSVRTSVVLKYMTWSWAFSYGDKNWFNFEKMEGSIAVLNGNNASGKSSFIDTLCISIFGEPGKGRNINSARKVTTDFLHHQRPPKTAMQTSVLMLVDGALHEIIRSYTHHESKLDDNVSQVRKCELHRIDADGTKTRVCSGATMVDAWVGKHCGTIEDLLRTTIVSQFDNYNFFMLKPQEQKEMIDGALNMDTLKAFANIVDVAYNGYSYLIDALATAMTTLQSAIGGKQEVVTECGAADADALHKKWQQLEQEKEHLAIKAASQLKKGQPEVSLYDARAYLESFDIVEKTADLEKRILKIESKLASMPSCGDDILMAASQFVGDIDEAMAQHESMRPHLSFAISDLLVAESIQKQWWGANADILDMIDMQYHCEKAICEALDSVKARYGDWQREAICPPSDVGRGIAITANDYESVIASIHRYRTAKSKLDQLNATLQTYEEFRTRYDDALAEADTYGWRSKGLMHCKLAVERMQVPISQEEWKKVKENISKSEFRNAEEVRTAILKSSVVADRAKFMRLTTRLETMGDVDVLLAEANAGLTKRSLLIHTRRIYRDLKAVRGMDKDYLQEKIQETTQQLKTIDYRKLLRQKVRYEKQCRLKNNIEFAATYVGNNKVRKIANLELLHEQMVFYEKYHAVMNAWNDEIGETATGNDWSRGVQILEFIESNADKYNEMTLLAEQQRSMIVEHEYAWNHAFVGWMSINKSLKTELDKLEKILAVAQERSEREVERHRIIKQRLVASRFVDWEATRARLIAIKNSLVCKELKSELESLTSQCALAKKRDTYASIVAWHLYQEAKAHAYELHETMANLRNAVALDDNMRLLTIYKTLTRDWCATRDLLGELQLRLADKRGAVQNAGNNFKDWVYSTYIIPLLEKHINSFLSCVDDIRVRIQYHAKGLRFFVLDRGNETAYAASSGYQQFIVGLGMRQALANIGGAGNNMKHMFIDEGFTACDAQNIQKAYEILQRLIEMGGFKSILIVSHLDSIKDVIPVKINVQRNGAFSRLRFG